MSSSNDRASQTTAKITPCLPPDPSIDGWHWLETRDGGCRMSILWIAATQRWDDGPSNQLRPEDVGGLGWKWVEHYDEAFAGTAS